jgi:hypothetical protein
MLLWERSSSREENDFQIRQTKKNRAEHSNHNDWRNSSNTENETSDDFVKSCETNKNKCNQN